MYQPGLLATLWLHAAGNPVTSLFAFLYLKKYTINASEANRSLLK